MDGCRHRPRGERISQGKRRPARKNSNCWRTPPRRRTASNCEGRRSSGGGKRPKSPPKTSRHPESGSCRIEGSLGETFKVTWRDPSTVARDDHLRGGVHTWSPIEVDRALRRAMPNNCGFRRLTNIEQGTARSTSHMIATVLVTVLEGQLSNS